MTLRYHLTPVRMTKIKIMRTTYTEEDVELGEHSSTADGSGNLYSHFGNQYGSFSENWESVYLQTQQYHSWAFFAVVVVRVSNVFDCLVNVLEKNLAVFCHR